MTSSTHRYSVKCTFCGAPRGEPCKGGTGQPRISVHAERHMRKQNLTKKTKDKSTVTARTELDAIKEQVMKDLAEVREALHALANSRITSIEEDHTFATALAGLETYVAVSLRVLNKTNPSKVRSEALTHAVLARLNGAKES